MLIQLVTYIFLPLLVAYITIVATKRKEVELEAQGQLLEHRVQAYSEVYRFMQRNLKLIAVPRYLEHLYVCCLDGSDYKIGVQGMEYVSYLSDIEQLDEYTHQLEQLISAMNSIWSLSWITNCPTSYNGFLMPQCFLKHFALPKTILYGISMNRPGNDRCALLAVSWE